MNEFVRKTFHAVSGLLIAGMIYLLEPVYFQFICLALITLGYYINQRLENKKKDYFTDFCVKNLGRKNETGKGVLYFLIGCFLVSLFFNKTIAIVSVLVLAISDAVATIVGIRGVHKIYKKKTLEGSTAFFISTFLIVSYFYNPIIGLIVSLIVTPVELFSFVDDNFSIPIIFSISVTLVNYFL